MDRLDLHHQGIASLLLGAGGSFPPRVEPRSGDTQDSAQDGDRPEVLVFLNEGEDHRCSLAKKAVAFFKMSHSVWRRLFSARRRWSSCSVAGRLPWPGKA